MSQPPLRHGQSSSNDYANGYQSSGSFHRYDRRNDSDEYPNGNGDAAASRERGGGGYGGFDDTTRLADSDLRQSNSRAQITESVNGGWHEEVQQEDRQRSGQSRNQDGGTRRVADGQGTRQIEG